MNHFDRDRDNHRPPGPCRFRSRGGSVASSGCIRLRESSSSAKVTPSTCGKHGFVLESLHIPLRLLNKSVPSFAYNVFWETVSDLVETEYLAMDSQVMVWAGHPSCPLQSDPPTMCGCTATLYHQIGKCVRQSNLHRSEVQAELWEQVAQSPSTKHGYVTASLPHPAPAHDVSPGTTVCGSTTLTFHTAMCWLT